MAEAVGDGFGKPSRSELEVDGVAVGVDLAGDAAFVVVLPCGCADAAGSRMSVRYRGWAAPRSGTRWSHRPGWVKVRRPPFRLRIHTPMCCLRVDDPGDAPFPSRRSYLAGDVGAAVQVLGGKTSGSSKTSRVFLLTSSMSRPLFLVEQVAGPSAM